MQRSIDGQKKHRCRLRSETAWRRPPVSYEVGDAARSHTCVVHMFGGDPALVESDASFTYWGLNGEKGR
jgi:hypothetical protein